MYYLLLFFTSLLLAMIVSPRVISFSRDWGLVDHPDARKQHDEPMPLAGGLILFPFVIVGLLVSFPAVESLPHILAGSTLIFGLGVWDDRFGTHFSTKFLIQVVAAFLVMQSGLIFDLGKIAFFREAGVEFGHFSSMAVTLLWIVGITNAVNIIDGMDGLAAGLCLNGFAGLGVIAMLSGRPDLAAFCVIMCGVLMGFLRFNIHPARTFLGDSGSMLLGFTIAVLSVSQSYKTTTFLVFVIPALLLALPMLDTAFAFTRRGVKGQNPFKPDRGHLHHRLLDLNFSPRQALGLFYSLSAGIGFSALWLAQSGRMQILVLAVSTLVLVLGVVKVMQVYNFHNAVKDLNSRMRIVAKKAMQKERSGEERLARKFFVLLGLCGVNLLFALLAPERNPVIGVAALGILAVGSVDVLLSRREINVRYEILHVALFISLVLNQFAIFGMWHQDYFIEPHMAVSAFLVLILLALIVYRTGTFAVFLQDPMEILALYAGIIICGVVRHVLDAPLILPFAVVVVNALVLYILLKIYLSGYRMRSWAHSLGFAACFAVLFSAPWWG
ncbi:undecaprenyl/decaprenyl-phosphate alpha-N-acetylglucosaminyl 1-phosphate transferase [bacterium]|nr:undecaprenyl/decaprenyl-phosphate alpha-N-acetylglucosaminyl 1-phosphate transferase [bacterium]